MEECLCLHEHCGQGTLLLVTFIWMLKELGYDIASMLTGTLLSYFIFMTDIESKGYSSHKCIVGLATLHMYNVRNFSVTM